MIDGLVNAGATAVCHAEQSGPLADMYTGWQTTSEARPAADVLGDTTLDLIVTAAVPSDRSRITVEALDKGLHVLSAKPGVTSLEDLDRIDAALDGSDPARRWWVFFSERLTNRAVIDAVRRVRAGEIGQLVAITGSAPHTLAADSREEWFFDPATSGGILVDLAAHQADQLLALSGAGVTEVRSAGVANVACAQHPTMQDLGRMSLRHVRSDGTVVLSDHHVDYLSPSGLGTWGDVRLMLTGTTGTIEVRSNIDVVGEPGDSHLIIVDSAGARRVDTTTVAVDWAAQLLRDIADGSDEFMPRGHARAACAITLEAQRIASETGIAP